MQTFRGSYMSDTRWRELLRLVYGSGLVRRVMIKMVLGDQPSPQGPWPLGRVTAEQFFHDTWVDDYTSMGPLYYKAIEWIWFPAEWPVPRGGPGVPPGRASQDVDAIVALISPLGQFETEKSDGLRVYGYR